MVHLACALVVWIHAVGVVEEVSDRIPLAHGQQHFLYVAEGGLGRGGIEQHGLAERLVCHGVETVVGVEAGDCGAQLRETLLRGEVAPERAVAHKAALVPVPELHVVLDDRGVELVGLGVDLHYEAVRGEVRVHPLDDVALLDVERVAQALVVEHHLREDAVDLHDAERARHLHASVLDLEVGVGGALAAVDLGDVDVERLGAVLLGGDPDLVAVQVALDAHVGVVG